MIAFKVPLQTTTGLNTREHWHERSLRTRGEKRAVGLALQAHVHWRDRARLKAWLVRGALVVTLTRVSPSAKPADDDNAAGGLKASRDAVAEWLGVDDGDPRVVWKVAVERGDWAVRIAITLAQQAKAAAEARARFLVVFQIEGNEPEIHEFWTEQAARERYENLSTNWSEVYLCRVLAGPRDGAPPPADKPEEPPCASAASKTSTRNAKTSRRGSTTSTASCAKRSS